MQSAKRKKENGRTCGRHFYPIQSVKTFNLFPPFSVCSSQRFVRAASPHPPTTAGGSLLLSASSPPFSERKACYASPYSRGFRALASLPMRLHRITNICLILSILPHNNLHHHPNYKSCLSPCPIFRFSLNRDTRQYLYHG